MTPNAASNDQLGLEYKIIKEDTASFLEIMVNQAIADGWEPIGGVSCAATSLSAVITFVQAMVRRHRPHTTRIPTCQEIFMTLREQQSKFAVMAANLILHAAKMGYEVTLGDAFRDPRLHGELGVKKGYGTANSFHKKRLAIDLNLFKDGKFLDGTEAHRPLGEWWESQGGTWGGRFRDGNHYSLGEGSSGTEG